MKYGNQALQSHSPLFHSFYTKEHKERNEQSIASPTFIASRTSHLDPAHVHTLPKTSATTDRISTSASTSIPTNTGLGEPAFTMEGTHSDENVARDENIDFANEIQWGEDTDYLFSSEILPRLGKMTQSNSVILARLLRQKLVHKISELKPP